MLPAYPDFHDTGLLMRLFFYMLLSAIISAAIFATAGYQTAKLYRYNVHTEMRAIVDKQIEMEQSELSRSLEAIYRIAVLSAPDTLQQNLQSYFDASASAYEKIFIVIKDGSILAHCDNSERIRLHNNIRNNTLYYNSSVILQSFNDNESTIRITDYNTIDSPVPLGEEELDLVETAIYRQIRANSLLAQKKIVFSEQVQGLINIISGKNRLHETIVQHLAELENQVLFIYAFFLLAAITCWIVLILIFRHIASSSVKSDIRTKAYLPQELIYENREIPQLSSEEDSSQLYMNGSDIENAIDSILSDNDESTSEGEAIGEDVVTDTSAAALSFTDTEENGDTALSGTADITDDLLSENSDIFYYDDELLTESVSAKKRSDGVMEIIEHSPSSTRIVIQDAIPIRKGRR